MKVKKGFKIASVVLLLAGAAIGFGYGISQAAKPDSTATPTVVASGTPMIPAGFSDLAERVRPSVVNIQVEVNVNAPNAGSPAEVTAAARAGVEPLLTQLARAVQAL